MEEVVFQILKWNTEWYNQRLNKSSSFMGCFGHEQLQFVAR